MMIPEFMHFYKYTLAQVLDEYAVSFYALHAAMYRLKARHALNTIGSYATAQGGDKSDEYLSELRKQERGLPGILNEVKIAKKARE